MVTRMGRAVVAARTVLPPAAWAALAAGIAIGVGVVLGAGIAAGTGSGTVAGRPGATALLVVRRVDGGRLTAADTATVERVLGRLAAARIPAVSGLDGPVRRATPDGTSAEVRVDFARDSRDPVTLRAVGELDARTADLLLGTALEARYTGDPVSAYDRQGRTVVVELGAAAATAVLFLLGRYAEGPRAARRRRGRPAVTTAWPGRRGWSGMAVGRQ